MASNEYFGNYTLSQKSLESLKEIENFLERDVFPADDAWNIIKPKSEKKDELTSVVKQEVRDDVEKNTAELVDTEPLTQFFYSQRDRNFTKPICPEVTMLGWLDAAASLLESLEGTSDEFQLVQLKNLSDEDAESAIKYLSGKLSIKGTYNICHSICAMSIDQSMRYIRMTFSNLLLPKIIDLEEPSRLIITVIHELVEKFPEDVQEFIYTPMLNEEIRDTSLFSAIINGYPPQRKNDLILNFLTVVHELKEWHISVLSELISSKITENVARDKLLDLLLEKATICSHDKNYGKFILSFIKLNFPFTDSQRRKLSEIVAVNETIYKRVMENLLKNMYLYGDLWHIA